MCPAKTSCIPTKSLSPIAILCPTRNANEFLTSMPIFNFHPNAKFQVSCTRAFKVNFISFWSPQAGLG